MVEFEEAAGGLTVQVDEKILGYIDRHGVFSVAQNLRERIILSTLDLRKIADKIDETLIRSVEGDDPLPS